MNGLWVVEEYRGQCWSAISGALSAQDAATAVCLLRADRPWRRYRLVSVP